MESSASGTSGNVSGMDEKRPVHAVIPSRYASSRFPGKPLALLHGRPMFWHVWNRASRCSLLRSVTLATDDERIREAARELDVPCVMTASRHQSGTDRVYEAATILGFPDDAVVVNIQGDEPALDPRCLDGLVALFNDADVRAATLARAVPASQAASPDVVKVVTNILGDALYFSRAAIPHDRDTGMPPSTVLAHMGLYAFTMETLRTFVSLPPSPLESLEKLEQLRLLDNGIAIRVALTEFSSPGVDREEDMQKVLPLL